MDSILINIKKLLGIDESYTAFDPDVIAHINAAFLALNQLGFCPFMISDASATWSEYFAANELPEVQYSAVRQYIYLKVRLMFDPPANSFTQQAFADQIKELEWRLNVQLETPIFGGTSPVLVN